MGLFAQQPEEPARWAGLPGEPKTRRTPSELLPDDASPGASPDALPGWDAASAVSISIAVPVTEVVDAPDGGD
ncbi:hypothetical protein ACIQLJ_05085 [Microbacterium sp. NPDC091313]